MLFIGGHLVYHLVDAVLGDLILDAQEAGSTVEVNLLLQIPLVDMETSRLKLINLSLFLPFEYVSEIGGTSVRIGHRRQFHVLLL